MTDIPPSPRRSNASANTALVINEPVPDRKGKKRAAPEPDSSSGDEHTQPSTSKQPPPKRTRTTRASASTSTKSAPKPTNMPKKARSSTSSAAAAAAKTRGAKNRKVLNPSAPGDQSGESDVEMLDAEMYSDDDDDDEQPTVDADSHANNDDDDEDDDEVLEKQRLDAELPGPSTIETDSPPTSSQPPAAEPPAAAAAPPPSVSTTAASLLSALNAEDSSAAALSMFGADFRSLGAHMMAHTTKLKGYLEAIKPSSDPLVRYSALQELNELLVMSNEDTLSGYFQVDAFTKELIGILGGKRTGGDEDDEEDHDDEHDEDDEDAALAAALAMSTGGVQAGDENPEAQVLASRCLYNMMEALPGTAHTVVFHGAIPALCSKLLEIQFIDLAEQNISVCGVLIICLLSHHLD